MQNEGIGLLNTATGGGKTVAALIAAESRPDLQLLVITVPTTNLVRQREEELQSVLEDAGVPDRVMLIVDEVHNAGAPTYRRILGSFYSLRLSLSATPERRYDEEGSAAIMDFFEEEVYHYFVEETLSDEQLSPYT
ncbi:MAG: hypothetical protein BRD40_00445 [Bacteroidetes bacterium QS_1_65_9]|nr:MAG: hypothetical protein BRD40_00445 [Bacteroidetes bacterium QS_1_65_9]